MFETFFAPVEYHTFNTKLWYNPIESLIQRMSFRYRALTRLTTLLLTCRCLVAVIIVLLQNEFDRAVELSGDTYHLVYGVATRR